MHPDDILKNLTPEQLVEVARTLGGEAAAMLARRRLFPPGPPPILTIDHWRTFMDTPEGRWGFKGYGFRFETREGPAVVLRGDLQAKINNNPIEYGEVMLWAADERFPGVDGGGWFGKRGGGEPWYLALEKSLTLELLQEAWEQFNPETLAQMQARAEEAIKRKEAERKKKEEEDRKWFKMPTPDAPWAVTVDAKGNGYAHAHFKPPGLGSFCYRTLSERHKEAAKFHFSIARLFNSMVEWFGVHSPDKKVAAEWKHTMDTYNGVWDNYRDCDELRDVIRWYRTDFRGMFKEFVRRRGAGKILSRVNAGDVGLRLLAEAAVRNGTPKDKARDMLATGERNVWDFKDEWLEKAIDTPGVDVAGVMASIFAGTHDKKHGPKPRDKFVAMLEEAEAAIAAVITHEPDLIDESAMPVNWRRKVGARKAAATRKERLGRKEPAYAEIPR